MQFNQDYLSYRNQLEDNNVNIMTQQSVADEIQVQIHIMII